MPTGPVKEVLERARLSEEKPLPIDCAGLPIPSIGAPLHLFNLLSEVVLISQKHLSMLQSCVRPQMTRLLLLKPPSRYK